jgi:ribosome-associated heat shock protein Hsp15
MIDVRSKLRFFGRSKNIKMLIARISKKGGRLLELTQKAVDLYEKQKTMEKRRILDLLFSNWTARFFKARALAVNGGKVEVNGDRPKPSRVVRIGDELNIRRGSYEWGVIVREVSRLRGPAMQAPSSVRRNRRKYPQTQSRYRSNEARAAARVRLRRPPIEEGPARALAVCQAWVVNRSPLFLVSQTFFAPVVAST